MVGCVPATLNQIEKHNKIEFCSVTLRQTALFAKCARKMITQANICAPAPECKEEGARGFFQVPFPNFVSCKL